VDDISENAKENRVKRNFITISDFTREEIIGTFDLTRQLKVKVNRKEEHHLLKGQTLAMLFQKPSTRTRVSFEVGMVQLGGHALYMSPGEVGLGKRESTADVARVISRYCNGIMARVFGHDIVTGLAHYSSVPVINGLSDFMHPCQIMGDIYTVMEHKNRYENLKIAYIGDGNNVANSWVELAGFLSLSLRLGVPDGYEPDPGLVQVARKNSRSEIIITHDPYEAVKEADVVYTDVWASMGQEDETEARKKIFSPYQVNQKLISGADRDCLVMHCLPAHRGDEITDEVMDGPHSVVFDEAENRLHVQKAILVMLMGVK
jgi:ornithine carbamoyltransferase